MDLTQRQQAILNYLVLEYIDIAEPVSSELLKKKCHLEVSPATIRSELQHLTEKGYVAQPHTSSGRVPTDKGYKYFIEITFRSEKKLPDFILKEIKEAKEKIDRELDLAKELMESLRGVSETLSSSRATENMIFEILMIIGPSKTAHSRNISLMKELLSEFENF